MHVQLTLQSQARMYVYDQSAKCKAVTFGDLKYHLAWI